MKKKLTVVVANPKSDEYYKQKIEEINAMFKSIYGNNSIVKTSKN